MLCTVRGFGHYTPRRMNPTIITVPKQPRRSKQEIVNGLRDLRTLRNKIPRTTAFDDDNRQAIRAEIHVIGAELTMEQVFDKYEDGEQYTLSSALNALGWLRDDAAPTSEGWTEMIAKLAAA